MDYRQQLQSIREFVSLLGKSATPFVKRRLLCTLLLIVASSVLTSLSPVALRDVVDRMASRSASQVELPLLLIFLYVMAQFLSRAITEIRGFIYARAERRIFRSLSERAFAHIMHLPLPFHINRETGGVAQTLANGLQGYQLVLNHFVFAIVPGVVELGTAMVVLLRSNQPTFFLIFGVGTVCSIAALAVFALRIGGPSARAAESHVVSTATMTDPVLNYEAVKLFTAEHTVQDRVSNALIRTEEEWVRFYAIHARNGFGVATVYAVFLAVAVLYSTVELQKGNMTIGTFVLMNTYILTALRPMELLGQAMQGVSQGLAMLGKMLELLREPTERPAPAIRAVPASAPATLTFDRVSFSYVPGQPVLRDVSFTVPAGKTLGIVGLSGSGKSTLVRLVVRLLEPAAGTILLDGLPVSTLSLSDVRGAVAVVPQETFLFNDTIGHNIGLGRVGSSQSEIEHAARLARIHDFIVSLPERYQTRIGERGIKLSGGERQRIAIARAVLKRPKIYVFDEATSSLDSRTEREILRSIRLVSRSTTTLIIAHRLSTVVHADEIMVLDGATVLERGTHSELLRLGGSYASLWSAQSEEGGRIDEPELQSITVR